MDSRTTLVEWHELAAPGRDAGVPSTVVNAGEGTVLVLESEEGEVFLANPARLRETLRHRPGARSADGSIDLIEALTPPDSERGFGSWVWARLGIVEVKDDALEAEAAKYAKTWAKEWLVDAATAKLDDASSWLFAKAIIWLIEHKKGGKSALCHWSEPGAPNRLDANMVTRHAKEGPLLLFLHGTASSTLGSFSDLQGVSTDWGRLRDQYKGRIYALEHLTFSESPVENALDLVRDLPEGARLHLVSHSRGGLVGDLLCLDPSAREQLEHWEREAADGVDEDMLRNVTRREKEKVRELLNEVKRKSIRVERYVRVACPARGTLLAGANLDSFVSLLLSVIGKIPALAASGGYSVVKELLIQVVKRRLDPQLVPGLECMAPGSPLTLLLSRAERRPGLAMRVIAGDAEGSGILKRLLVTLTDWMIFQRLDHDLVVDTESMYQGVARDGNCLAVFDQGPEVSHFRYFENAATRRALCAWLIEKVAEGAADAPPEAGADTRARTNARAAAADPLRPVVFVLPGLMGSNLDRVEPDESGGTRVERLWLSPASARKGAFARMPWDPARDAGTVRPASLVRLYYDGILNFLEEKRRHRVEAFPYDWRAPLEEEADRLARRVCEVLNETETPNPRPAVRFLAHSMGGMLFRTLLVRHPDLWLRVAEREGSHAVLVGSPHQGSHLIVKHLLGLTTSLRALALADPHHTLQTFLEVFATFPGAASMLPRPDSKDTTDDYGGMYFDPKTWHDLKARRRDRRFERNTGGLPSEETLRKAREFWQTLGDALPAVGADRIRLVVGKGTGTPAGLKLDSEGKVRLSTTEEGDGSVTWKSALWKGVPPAHIRFMDVRHEWMLASPSHFDDLADLLETGNGGLQAWPQPGNPEIQAGTERSWYEPPPAQPLTLEEILGEGEVPPRRRRPSSRASESALRVSVKAGDLRFARHPVLCGHFENDPIAGAEALLDSHVVEGALRQRALLGVYPGLIGTSLLVHRAAMPGTNPADSRAGALVVGLGNFLDPLSPHRLREAVRAGILRLLLDAQEHDRPADLSLHTLLVGRNSSVGLTVRDCVDAIVLGVAEANHLYRGTTRNVAPPQVVDLEILEVFWDAAHSATHALAGAANRLRPHLHALKCRLVADARLGEAPGARHRLDVEDSASGYWPRLLVAGADEKGARGKDRFRFLYQGARARAEKVDEIRQPELLEMLVREGTASTRHRPDFGRLLFGLLVPVLFKETARQMDRLVLVVDEHTADLPWEMLVAGDDPVNGVSTGRDEPLVTRMQLVRQLVSGRTTFAGRDPSGHSALVIGNPSTAGFDRAFALPGAGDADVTALSSLPGAEREAGEVRKILEDRGYEVSIAMGANAGFRDVMTALLTRPHRIVHIAAHGLFEIPGRDGHPRTGVVLSDGMVLSALEFGKMEVVPELVFLNCCHLGRTANMVNAGRKDTHRLAYGLAKELIARGVRCVVAAGWEVDDAAALSFARIFYQQMVVDHASFAEALLEARKGVFDNHGATNTWGAYQAYGDPQYRISGTGAPSSLRDPPVCCSGLEAAQRIDAITTDVKVYRDTSASTIGLAERIQGAGNALRALLATLPEASARDARVLQAQGDFAAETGDFPAAIRHYSAALGAPDSSQAQRVKTIEQLANLEARHGERSQDEVLVTKAVERLRALIGATRDASPAGVPDPERHALLGSACKRMAVLLAKSGKATPKPAEVTEWLQKAAEAYRAAEGVPGQAGFKPYLALNRIQLELLLGAPGKSNRAALIRLVESATSRADETFKKSGDFFDSVTRVDASMTKRWLQGTLARDARSLVADYIVAIGEVPSTKRMISSVLDQFDILARLARVLGQPKGLVAALESIATGMRAADAPAAGAPGEGSGKAARPRAAKNKPG